MLCIFMGRYGTYCGTSCNWIASIPRTLCSCGYINETKTLRGLLGGLILSSEEFAKEHELNKALFSGIKVGYWKIPLQQKRCALKKH